jgi:hypothetical protein
MIWRHFCIDVVRAEFTRFLYKFWPGRFSCLLSNAGDGDVDESELGFVFCPPPLVAIIRTGPEESTIEH